MKKYISFSYKYKKKSFSRIFIFDKKAYSMKENNKMRVLQLFFRQNFNLNELMQQSNFFPNFNYNFDNCKYLAAEKILNSHENLKYRSKFKK